MVVGGCPGAFFESAQSATTAEREIVRLIKDTPCYHSTHHHQTYKEHGYTVSCTSKHTQLGDTIPFMTNNNVPPQTNTTRASIDSSMSVLHIVAPRCCWIVDPPLGNGRRVFAVATAHQVRTRSTSPRVLGNFCHRTARSCHLPDYM